MLCREFFSGRGRLSDELKRIGLPVAVGMEAYPERTKYVREHDLDRPEVIRQIERDIKHRKYAYVHFSLPCSS